MKRLLVVVVGLALALIGSVAVAAWLSSGDGSGTATATTVNQANAPATTRVASTVSLSWTPSTLASGAAVSGYKVYRHVGSTSTPVCTVTSPTCVDTTPAATQVTYGVVATIGTNWRGPESDLTAFTFDDVAPTTTADVTPVPNAAGWNKAPGNVTVDLEATDTGSSPSAGVDHISYTLDGGSAVGVNGASASVPISGAGNHTLTYFAVDGAGNTEDTHTLTVKIDPNAPVTAVTPNPVPTWSKTDVTLNFSATDTGTSGIKSVTVDGVATNGAAAVKTVSAEGATTVHYFATDNADNVEGTKSVTVQIDKTAPTTSIDPASSAIWTTDNSIAITANDDRSGVASIEYRVDSGSIQTYSTPFTLADGSHTVEYRATDVAGNVQTFQSATIKVDTVKPTSSIASTTSTTWTITANDAAPSSGVSIEYWIDSGTHTVVSGTTAVVTVPSGNHAIHWFAKDAASNVETQHDLSVTVTTADTTAPTISLTYPAQGDSINNGQWTNNGCTLVGKPAGLCGTASDNVGVVGPALYELRRTSASPNTCWSGSVFTQAACGSYQTAGGTGSSWQIALPFSSLPAGNYELRVKVSDAASNSNRAGTSPGGTADLSFTR